MGINYNPNPIPTARGSANLRSAERRDSTTTNTLPNMSEKQIEEMMEERKKKEEEAKRQQRLAEIEAARKKEAERKAYIERLREVEEERTMTKAKGIAPDYRREYDAGDPQSFNDAKKAADETYMQFWYDKANAITDKWTDEDYKSLVEPRYEDVVIDSKRGATKKQRAYPKGYDQFLEIKERIDYGVLDFNSEEDHKKLIKSPSNRGYGKYQYWIDESNPLRQAVEAQADVMKDFLDDAGVPIVQKYEDLKGFDRPDSFRGEGIYLNTGTGAHINWDSGLKRMQRYQTSPDAELGTYSNVFVRPDPEGIAKPLAFVGSITGNPWLTAASAVAAGGDLEDALKGAVKGYAIGQVTAPILENTVANLGIDKDLFGMDAEAFSEGMMDVQTTILEGGDIDKALLKEFGVDAVKQLGSALPDVDIDLPESQLFSDIGDALEPIVGAVRAGGRAIDETLLQPVKRGLEPVVDVAQEGIDVLQQAGRGFDDAVLQPVKEGVQAVTEPVVDVVDAFIDAVDSPLGDLLGAGGDLLGGMLGGGQGQQQLASTPTEGLFDKELFKFDTEIKSTQEMLSPMMNLRKYG